MAIVFRPINLCSFNVLKISGHKNVSGVEYFEVLKVDKLLLRSDLFRQIARTLL